MALQSPQARACGVGCDLAALHAQGRCQGPGARKCSGLSQASDLRNLTCDVGCCCAAAHSPTDVLACCPGACDTLTLFADSQQRVHAWPLCCEEGCVCVYRLIGVEMPLLMVWAPGGQAEPNCRGHNLKCLFDLQRDI